MKIVICGSMAFAKEMKMTKCLLEKRGHTVVVPLLVDKFIKNPDWYGKLRRKKEHAKLKKKHNLIRAHYREIEKAEAILVLNHTKNGIKNYIGGNSFLEMGFAYILGRKIYLLNEIPEIDLYYQEILAMEPVILNGDFSKIK